MKMFKDVRDFHEKFGMLPLGAGPLSAMDSRRRADQMREELREFEDACADSDPVKAVDALVDLAYFTLGSAVSMGVQETTWQRCWDAVHSANMAKARTGNSHGLKQGIEKPAGWISPEGAIKEALIDDGFAL